MSAISVPAMGLCDIFIASSLQGWNRKFRRFLPLNFLSCCSFLSKSKLAAAGYDRSKATEPTLMSPCKCVVVPKPSKTASEFDGGVHNGGSNARKTMKFFDPGPVQFPVARSMGPRRESGITVALEGSESIGEHDSGSVDWWRVG